MRDEGVIKFNCAWKKTAALPENQVRELIQIRQKLFQLGLIGVYPDGIGYGNVSLLSPSKKQFIISGSQTGQLTEATAEHFALVTDYSIAANRVYCEGPIQASSESLTHAMIYETFPKIMAVIHVHSSKLWRKLSHIVPTSGEKVPYGTPEMAHEIKRLAQECGLDHHKILVMAGHEDGVITFGTSLTDAHTTLMGYMDTIT